MNTRLALAVSLAVSMTSAISAESIAIKGMYLGMTMDNAVVALSNALDVSAEDLLVVKLGDGVKSCIFSPGLKLDFELDGNADADKALCGTTTNNPEAIIFMIQYDIGVRINRVARGKSLDKYGIRQMAPLATFVNDSMVTMTLESNVVNSIFSYDKTEFTTFAKGFASAYGIPTLNNVKCTFKPDNKCWDYNDGNGTLVSLLDLGTSAPLIQMFKTSVVKF